MWLWVPLTFCPFSQKPIQLCTIVRLWQNIDIPWSALFTIFTPIWGPIDCLALVVIFAERLEFGGGRAIGKTLTLAATAQYGKALSPLFFCLLTLAVRLFYPWRSWMHKSQLIFYHHWQSREMRSLGKQTNNYSHLENVMMKVVVVHSGSTRWPDILNVNRVSTESDQSEKSFTLGLKGFSLLHSSPPDQSGSHHHHHCGDDWWRMWYFVGVIKNQLTPFLK